MSITARFADTAPAAPAAPTKGGSIGTVLIASGLASVIGYQTGYDRSERVLHAVIAFIATAGLTGSLLAPPKAPDRT